MSNRRGVFIAITVLAGLAIGGCSGDDHAMDGPGAMHRDGDRRIDVPQGAVFNETDVFFAQGMIPHHGQAVQMAEMALAAATDPEVRSLAEQVKAAQDPEIEQMTAWLTDREQSVPDRNEMMDEGMDQSGGMKMSGMMSAAEMGRLGEASGVDFDRIWLEMMIRHHEGAIEMATEQLADGKYGPVKDLAKAIIDGQQAEIDEMNGLLDRIAT